MILAPYFELVDAPGCGGKIVWMFSRTWCPVSVIISEPETVSKWGLWRDFNPFFDLSSRGITFGLFGRNVWLSWGL